MFMLTVLLSQKLETIGNNDGDIDILFVSAVFYEKCHNNALTISHQLLVKFK